MVSGKILPAGQACQRWATSVAAAWRSSAPLGPRVSSVPAAPAAASRVRPKVKARADVTTKAGHARRSFPSSTPPTLDAFRGDLAELAPNQYVGNDGSTVLIQLSTPPPTCTASEKPAFLSTASTSAERAPDLQCRTIRLSWGMPDSAAPVRNSPLGISTAPGMLTISYSLGSRTSIR